MRIVITRLGKNEIKDVDYGDMPKLNYLNQKKNARTISYNKIPNNNNIPIYGNNNKIYKQRINKSIEQNIVYEQYPSIKQLNASSNNSFLSKIGELSMQKNKEFKTPNRRKLNPEIKNNIELFKLPTNRDKNTLFITQSNNYDTLFKKVKITQKKLNIPVSMLDKYSKVVIKSNKNENSDSDVFNSNEELKVNNTESNALLEKDKYYSLREILQPKNQKNIDKSYLDKKINSNGSESIISYLQMDKDISPSLIVKINKSSDDQLYKLDKVCQKYFNDEKLKTILDNEIKEKIKKEYEQDSIYCKNNLNNMSLSLKNYNNVYKRLRLKKENYDNYKNLYLSHKK
jgi:hypothetical protein